MSSTKKETISTTEKDKETRTYQLPRSKVKNKIQNFFELSKSKRFIAFYSISFPLGTQEDVAYRLFNIWLTRCRKDKGLTDYLWVAERQKNGTIHYHLITNNYMYIEDVNGYMKSALKTAAKRGDINEPMSKIEVYNGVDVDNLYKSKRREDYGKNLNKTEARRKLSRYLTKYVTKNEETFKHLTWHCSRTISRLFTGIVLSDSELEALENYISNYADKISVFESEFVTTYFFKFQLADNLFNIMNLANNAISAHLS